MRHMASQPIDQKQLAKRIHDVVGAVHPNKKHAKKGDDGTQIQTCSCLVCHSMSQQARTWWSFAEKEKQCWEMKVAIQAVVRLNGQIPIQLGWCSMGQIKCIARKKEPRRKPWTKLHQSLLLQPKRRHFNLLFSSRIPLMNKTHPQPNLHQKKKVQRVPAKRTHIKRKEQKEIQNEIVKWVSAEQSRHDTVHNAGVTIISTCGDHHDRWSVHCLCDLFSIDMSWCHGNCNSLNGRAENS